ncbi:hypothetical protein LTR15_010400 [Elasticomyces elasticus]|nr:hypothetical protein LTR15_010400 [Elasticomyces elasticus]
MANSIREYGCSLAETDVTYADPPPTLNILKLSNGTTSGVTPMMNARDAYPTPSLNHRTQTQEDFQELSEIARSAQTLSPEQANGLPSKTLSSGQRRLLTGLQRSTSILEPSDIIPLDTTQEESLTVQTLSPDQANGLPPVTHSLSQGRLPVKLQRSAPSQPGVPQVKVCEKCADLKLTFESFVIDDDTQSTTSRRPSFHGKRAMGSYKEIAERAERTACELCQLLMKSLENRPAASTGMTYGDHGVAKCGLFWLVDGRETVKSDEAPSTRSVKRTRRLAIEWVANGMAYDLSYIVLVASDGCFRPDGTVNSKNKQGVNAGKSTFFLGRKLTSLDVGNTELVKRWLDLCRGSHLDCRVNHTSSAFRDLQTQACFTVVDVRRMMLSELPQGAEYVALSYTWGPTNDATATFWVPPPPRFKVTDLNVRELEQENGVGRVLHRLPVAIQNAIALTQHLGFNYIWIDSLCIIQGNNESWKANASLMDVIYGYAELTICAADGDGANVGLEALYSSNKEHESSYRPAVDQQVIVKYPVHDSRQCPLELMLSWPSETYVACSRWNGRAWTFQERMLSPRCLICVNKRVYFQCKTTTLAEDIYSDVNTEIGSAGWSVELKGAPALMFKRLAVDPVHVYKDCLRMCTSRQLSDESDILSAFDGIGKVVCEGLTYLNREDVDGSALLFGLPASHFDYALLWQPKEVAVRRNLGSTFFPSWSWSGWKCEKGMTYRPVAVAAPEVNLHEWLMKHTWITYYIRDSRGHLRLVWDPTCQDEIRECRDRWKGYVSPGTGFPGSSNPEISVDLHGRPWNHRLPPRGRLHENGTDPAQQDKQFDHRLHTFRAKPRILAPGTKKAKGRDMPYLQFYTWWGRFYVDADGQDDTPVETHGPSPGSVGTGLKRYSILDYHGDCVGVVVLDEEWARHRSASAPQEFIAISRARAFDEDEHRARGLYAEEDEDGSRPWQLYNVLMIVRDDPNKKPHEGDAVAYRRGLGKMTRQAFEHSCPDRPDEKGPLANQWREILLG